MNIDNPKIWSLTDGSQGMISQTKGLANKLSINIKEVKNTIIQNDGYVTIIKKSEDFEFTEKLFTIDDTKLMISKKIKESFDPRGLFNPGKMYKDF